MPSRQPSPAGGRGGRLSLSSPSPSRRRTGPLITTADRSALPSPACGGRCPKGGWGSALTPALSRRRERGRLSLPSPSRRPTDPSSLRPIAVLFLPLLAGEGARRADGGIALTPALSGRRERERPSSPSPSPSPSPTDPSSLWPIAAVFLPLPAGRRALGVEGARRAEGGRPGLTPFTHVRGRWPRYRWMVCRCRCRGQACAPVTSREAARSRVPRTRRAGGGLSRGAATRRSGRPHRSRRPRWWPRPRRGRARAPRRCAAGRPARCGGPWASA